jgi:glucokinase
VASGNAIGRLGREAAREDPSGAIAHLAGDPDAVTGAIVTRAAIEGDRTAVEILGVVGTRLGIGIAGLVNVLDPQVVIVGGGAVAAGDLLLGPARIAFHDTVEAPDRRPSVPIVAAQLGNDAGAVGAAALALEELGRLP